MKNFLIGCSYLLLVLLLVRNKDGGDILFIILSWVCVLVHFMILLFRRNSKEMRVYKILGVFFTVLMLYMIIYTVNKVREENNRFEIITE